LVAGSFWLLAKVHFDDDFRLQARHVALLAGALLAAALASPAAAPVSPLIRLLPKVLGLAFAVHALLTIYVGARSDLMVSRLRLRCVAWGSRAPTPLQRLPRARWVEGSPAQAPAELLAGVVRGLLSFGLIALSLSVRPDILRPPRVDPEAPVVDPRLAVLLR